MQMKLVAAALLGLVLVAAAACGGGGSLSKMEEETLQADRDAAVEAAEKAAEAAEAARMAAEEAERQRQAEQEAREAAEAEAAEAERKRQAEEEAREAAEEEAKKAEEAKKKAEEDAKKAEEERRKAEEAAARERQAAAERERQAREAAEQRAQQAQEEADRRIAEAERQGDVRVRAGALITDFGTLEEATEISVEHSAGGRRTFSRPLNLPAAGSAPSVPGGWSSASYSGPRGTVGTDTVYIYTNIQAPSKRRFWQQYGATQEVTGTDALARTTGSRSTPRQTAGANTADDAADDRFRVTYGGTYHGAGGTFSCTGTTAADDVCVLTNAETVAAGLTVTEGTWTFTPSSVNNTIGANMPDRTYLYFGIWAFEPTDPAATEDDAHEFKWARGGTAITGYDALTGTAKFAGGAIGRYALAQVGRQAAKVGTFTATANFTADFDENELSGRITDFKEGGSSLGSDWHVFLGATDSTAADLTAPGTTGTSGATGAHGAINGHDATGGWAATLYGSDNAGANSLRTADAEKYPASRYPAVELTGVAGWFNATAGTSAAIAGAFGAACTADCAK